jgi:ferric-dicitrate binding protein FerR (iron transport regulator)
MELPERIWHLMARVLNGEASSLEQDELCSLLSQNPHLQQQHELLRRVWKEKEGETNDEEQIKRYISKIINRAEAIIDNRTEEFARNRRRRRRIAVLSSFALLLIIAGVWWSLSGPNSAFPVTSSNKEVAVLSAAQQEVLTAPKGSRIRSILPDGSTIWLNGGSKLYFENDFSGKTREVRLEGEGFFDIAKKPKQPFIVHTSGIDIRVLGTAFNVKAYPEDEMVETTLYRGLVQVFRSEGVRSSSDKEDKSSFVELKPNEKLSIPRHELAISIPQKEKLVVKATPAFVITHIDSTKKENERIETAWRYSRLEFRGDNFGTLARKLERWYNVKVVFGDDNVKWLSFDGSFERETIEEALAALKQANAFQYEINKNEILIKSLK